MLHQQHSSFWRLVDGKKFIILEGPVSLDGVEMGETYGCYKLPLSFKRLTFPSFISSPNRLDRRDICVVIVNVGGSLSGKPVILNETSDY